jgi:hypothetical protein
MRWGEFILQRKTDTVLLLSRFTAGIDQSTRQKWIKQHNSIKQKRRLKSNSDMMHRLVPHLLTHIYGYSFTERKCRSLEKYRNRSTIE